MLSIQIEQPRRSFTVRVCLDVSEGQIYCLFGPSGAGKTTVLSVAGGFERLYRGSIALNGTLLAESGESRRFHLPVWQRQLGYVSQSTHLFPHLDVAKNIAFALPKNNLDDYTHGLINALGLKDYLSASVNTLSGGQKQKVAIARALAARPQVLLLDEPFSSLDQPSREEMQELITQIQKQLRLTMLLVTHQLTEAQRLAHQIGVLDKGEILQEAGPAELVNCPVSIKVALLAGYKAFLPAELFSLGEGLVALHPDRVLLGRLPDRGPVGQATVERCYPYDGHWRLGLHMACGQTLEATSDENKGWHAGEEVSFTLLSPPILSDDTEFSQELGMTGYFSAVSSC